jgi:hypothetical protein
MFKVPSFWIIVLQGVFGSIPWHAFGFITCVGIRKRIGVLRGAVLLLSA